MVSLHNLYHIKLAVLNAYKQTRWLCSFKIHYFSTLISTSLGHEPLFPFKYSKEFHPFLPSTHTKAQISHKGSFLIPASSPSGNPTLRAFLAIRSVGLEKLCNAVDQGSPRRKPRKTSEIETLWIIYNLNSYLQPSGLQQLKV